MFFVNAPTRIIHRLSRPNYEEIKNQKLKAKMTDTNSKIDYGDVWLLRRFHEDCHVALPWKGASQ